MVPAFFFHGQELGSRRPFGGTVSQLALRLASALRSKLVDIRACSSTVEQGTHNPLVLGSNPGGPTTNL